MRAGKSRIATRPSRTNLFRVWLIRSILAVFLAAGVGFLSNDPGVSLPWLALTVALSAAFGFNLLVAIRLARPWPVGEVEFFFNLLFDVAFLTVVLYLSGGSTNPLVSYYLIPLIISAAVLRPVFTWVIALLTVSAYTLLLFWFVPFELLAGTAVGHAEHASSPVLSAHFVGMWINFAFSALLISWFVVRMAQTIQQQEEMVTSSREQVMRDEQIIGVAGIAAGTAHELRTPLATMTVLVDELQQTESGITDELQLMQDQLTRCDQIIRNLVDSAEQGPISRTRTVSSLVSEIQDKWSIVRPETQLAIDVHPDVGTARLRYDVGLHHALLNFLHNAADASPADVALSLRRENGDILIVIADRGPGVPEEIAASLGKRMITRKEGGLGLGVLVSSASIERLNGRVILLNRRGGGTRLEIRLPEDSGDVQQAE